MADNQQDLIVALDVGTSKVAALIAQVSSDGLLEVIGVGKKASRGLKRGMVVNIDQTIQDIQAAISEAESMADCSIHSVYVGIAGSHILSRNLHGVVAVPNGEVTQSDIDRVLEAAKTGAVMPDHKVLHVLPQEFIVDHQEDVRNPLGMSGVRLEGHHHLVSCSLNAWQNLEKCVRGCGIGIDEVVLEPLAAADAVLSDDEKQLGVCLVDIGAGTTDIAVYVHGSLRHTAILPVAGDQVTNDVAITLHTPTPEAEDLKVKHACAQARLVNREDMINVPGMGDRPLRKLQRHFLASVVEARYEEIFRMVQEELVHAGLMGYMGAGIVLTGGASRIEGASALAESVLAMPVRVGVPNGVKSGGMGDILKNPVYATGVGLLMFGKQRLHEVREVLPTRRNPSGNGGMFQKWRQWLEAHF